MSETNTTKQLTNVVIDVTQESCYELWSMRKKKVGYRFFPHSNMSGWIPQVGQVFMLQPITSLSQPSFRSYSVILDQLEVFIITKERHLIHCKAFLTTKSKTLKQKCSPIKIGYVKLRWLQIAALETAGTFLLWKTFIRTG